MKGITVALSIGHEVAFFMGEQPLENTLCHRAMDPPCMVGCPIGLPTKADSSVGNKLGP